MTDQLSEVFELVEVRGLVSGGFVAQGSRVSRASLAETFKFLAMVGGQARLLTDGLDAPIELLPGDVAILNNRTEVELSGGNGDGPVREIEPVESGLDLLAADWNTHDIVLGGRIDLNEAGQTLLGEALPPVAHVQASPTTGANLRGSLHRLFDEVTGNRIGSAFAIRQHAQLVLLEVLRTYVEQTELPPGWLRVLTDERLRPALTLMHSHPDKLWGLNDLARAAAMSRTAFAERFRAVAGMPPRAYLNRWRMMLAQRALRDADISVGALAIELGYASESAFSTAFKRETGQSPLRYRLTTRARTG
ncbi:AraC family transcriptional regulator [Kribbella shirazensis]|uniref:AraC-like DNA-binding protein n=1 Tax=Kribbella shirazensis TaxID=1105143 RepID=A0A7X5VET9_9ACTN|nr:AraC family transcriptional regulator [Kribbella shirazensis]NIK59920.1 AraC-like DNA-binding protein [Kribbella shirazensis]